MNIELSLSLTQEEVVALRALVKPLTSGKEQVMLRLKVAEAILDAAVSPPEVKSQSDTK